MPTYVSGSSGKDFAPAPEGTHQAVCVDVIDLGVLETQWGDKHKVQLRWQISERMDTGKPFLVSKRYTASLNEKATLRKDLESWRGRAFTATELDRFDLDMIMGTNCLVNVQHHKDAQGRTWANVVSVSPLIKGMKPIAAEDYIRERDRVPQDADDAQSAESEDPIPF